MPPTSTSTESTKLPVAPNMDQILNRISLGLAKHESVLKTLRATSASTTTTTSAPASRSSAGFSSLGGVTPRAATTAGANPRSAAEVERADFAADRALPPNAGVGWQAPPSEGGAAAAGKKSEQDRALRARLLGGKGKGGVAGDVGRGKRGRGAYDSESEEEEGRSGLGKGKRRKAGGGALVSDPVVERTLSSVAPKSGGDRDGNAERDEEEGKMDLEEMTQSGSGAISPEPANSSKKKRKKRKNRKKDKGSTQAKSGEGDVTA